MTRCTDLTLQGRARVKDEAKRQWPHVCTLLVMEEGRTDRPNRDRATSETTEHTTKLRATVGEAAELLGITAEAVRSRIKRKTLKSTKEGSTVYVLLEAGGTHGSQTADQTTTEHDGTNAQTSTEQTTGQSWSMSYAIKWSTSASSSEKKGRRGGGRICCWRGSRRRTQPSRGRFGS